MSERRYRVVPALVTTGALLLALAGPARPVTGQDPTHASPTHPPASHAPATHAPSRTPTATLSPSLAVSIDVDGSQRFQVFDGFGGALSTVEDDTYRAHDPAQPSGVTATRADIEGIAALLYSQLGIARARIFLEAFEPSNDDGNPGRIRAAGFDWSGVDPEADFVALSRPLGLRTWWTTYSIWGEQDAWLRPPGDACRLDPGRIDELVEWHVASVLHLREKGVEPAFLAVMNEPDFAPACGPDASVVTVDDMVTIVKRLGRRLRDEGSQARIVISDGLSPQRSLPYMEAVLADPRAREFVGAIAYHSYADAYPDPLRVLSTSALGAPDPAAVAARQSVLDLAERYSLPVWMTEVCVCVPTTADLDVFELGRARLNHFLDELTIANVSAIDVMLLFFIERPGVGDELVHIYFRPDGSLDHYQVSTYGYLVGQLARAAPPGSVRIAAESNAATVRPVAFTRPDGGASLVVLNNEDVAVRADVTFAGLDRAPTRLAVLTSQDGSMWEAGPFLAVEDGGTSVVLAPRSLTTLTAP